MSDLHDRFGAWLTDGARTELPRDAALHASTCDACLRDAAAFDALLAIDPGAADLPPLRLSVPAARTSPITLLRGAVGIAAALLLAVSVGVGAGGLLDQRAELAAPDVSPTPDGEGVLAGGGAPAASATATAETSAGADASVGLNASPEPPVDDPEPTPEIGLATPGLVATPRPSTIITPPAGTPRPSSSGTATPAPTRTPAPSLPPTATPSPTPDPTSGPTPTPEPTPTPSPPPGCSDGLDNDADGLIDFGLDPFVNDPDCLSPDDDEAGVLP